MRLRGYRAKVATEGADRGWDGGAAGGSGADVAVAAAVMGWRLRVRLDVLASVGYGAAVTLAAFGLVVVAATVGNVLGGAAGRETALVAVSVVAVGLALLFGSYELRRRAEGERLARAGGVGAAGRVRRRAWRGLLSP